MGKTGKRVVMNRQCDNCPALCCKDLIIPTDKPRTSEQIDEVKWHIQYDTVRVFIRSHRWYYIVHGRCQYLTEDNLCSIYERRPHRCRRLNPPECERFGCFYDVMIETPEELDEHLSRKHPRRTRSGRR